MAAYDFSDKIVSIPDYPQPGVIFKDITTLLRDAEGFQRAVDELSNHFINQGITKVVGAEARGFIIAAPVAYKLNAGLVPMRKPGKLPREVYSQEYGLEYGSDELQVHTDAITKDDRVLLVDDLIATGGTAVAQAKLLSKFGATLVGMAFLMELDYLNPRKVVREATDCDIFSLVHVS
ncbi:adenine phosphoribosyltransferase [Denitrobacterium detoxificans]|jgi:adenine phosphoribosyltransferase|uniref:adenine phosphoribosyltransferase n=1 Tax=Denitrobacterium detoxificans TaxID=79604 RepID=UPI0026F2EB65|nr:adenine phosphoribosyltransferase [Denitrobacterium detoxificans]MBE6466181.1 adenine phosphoribosyltransferase [Denitrobacterium detoxificans]